jgi:tetratricopeptide (TPR) repeat protein
LDRLTAEADLSLPTIVTPPLSPEFSQRLEDSLRGAADDQDGEWLPGLSDIPGYHLLEVIGRGGSSIVFRAHDQKLRRAVAIKVLRSRAGVVDRERFQREATALASLRHPNITRAHGAGETNERPYLVMEHIAGGSLGRQIAGQPQAPHAAARLIRQLADAIDAAHAAGFVHRDLKPSNVLLDRHFGQAETAGLDRFVPKVTDLGIVKDLNCDDDITKTRDFLGTPSYMAPEQVRGSGQNVDCRTDIYALGAVLYELLTGRPPFRAGSPFDTMLQVKHDEPVPPSELCPKLPRDLETICLKCLEKDPGRRYSTARELANDVDRWLKGQPILARRTGWIGKLWRWSLRNPGWAAVALFVSMVLLALAIGGPLVAKRERHLREQALDHERAAQRERARARDQYELASQALERTLDHVLRSARLQDAALDDVRAGLIHVALPYYGQILQNADADRTIRLRHARMLLQLASVQTKENSPDKAREAYQRSLALLDSLSRDTESLDRETRVSLGSAHMEYGRFLQINDNDLPNAERHYRLSLEQRTAVLEQVPDDVKCRDNVAITLSLLGTLLRPMASRAEEAESFLIRAVQVRDQLVADLPDRADLRHYAAMAHMNLAMLYRQQDKHPEELRHMQMAWDLERALKAAPTTSLETPFYASYLQGQLGVAYARSAQWNEATVHLRASLRAADALVEIFPGVNKYTVLREEFQEMLDWVEKKQPLR